MSDPQTAPIESRLSYLGGVRAPGGVVLLLHGGAERGREPVTTTSRAWLRSRLMQRTIAPALARRGVTTALLRFRVRGWNGEDGAVPSPLADAREALAAVARRHPGVPVVLVGHSMGGRTAVHVAGHDAVAGVVGLAPWLTDDDPVGPLTGRTLVAAHGARDPITSPVATRAYVRRAAAVADRARFVAMGPVGHYLLRRPRAWDGVALRGVAEALGAAGLDNPEPGLARTVRRRTLR